MQVSADVARVITVKFDQRDLLPAAGERNARHVGGAEIHTLVAAVGAASAQRPHPAAGTGQDEVVQALDCQDRHAGINGRGRVGSIKSPMLGRMGKGVQVDPKGAANIGDGAAHVQQRSIWVCPPDLEMIEPGEGGQLLIILPSRGESVREFRGA